MSGEGSWRSANYAERFKDHDHADFAQEFLRRNPDYIRDFALTEQRANADSAVAQEEKEGLAWRWGLSFPLRSDQVVEGRAGPLVAQCIGDDNHLFQKG